MSPWLAILTHDPWEHSEKKNIQDGPMTFHKSLESHLFYWTVSPIKNKYQSNISTHNLLIHNYYVPYQVFFPHKPLADDRTLRPPPPLRLDNLASLYSPSWH